MREASKRTDPKRDLWNEHKRKALALRWWGVVCWNTRQIDFLADSNSSSAAVHHGLHKWSAILIKCSGKKHASAPPPERLTATGLQEMRRGNRQGRKSFQHPPCVCRVASKQDAWLQNHLGYKEINTFWHALMLLTSPGSEACSVSCFHRWLELALLNLACYKTGL